MNPQNSWEATVTAPDQAYYQQVYQYEGENKSQDAMTAFLRHAQDVSPQQLNQILGAAFQVNTSNVADNKRSFYMALKLIACAQHGINPSSPILSTSTPLPIFKDYELITTKDRQKYLRIFHASSPTDGLINGDQAMKILMRSKLPVSLLSHIWNLADMDRQGKLDSTGFVIAMHYVAKCMSGNTSLPHANAPDSILKSARGESPSLATMTTSKPSPRTTDKLGPTSPPPRPPPPAPPASAPAPPVSTTSTSTPDQLLRSSPVTQQQPPDIFSPLTQNHPWNVDKTEIDAYNHAFNTIDTGNKGYIEGSEAVGFFGHSNLPPSDLAGVWDLADTQNRGQLSQDEFAIAMHLIRRVRGGSPLPTTLPASMLSHFQSKNKEALTARVNHLQETIAKEQEDLPEIQQAAKDQEKVVSDLQKQVDALEQSLQQVVQQKSDLQATLDTLKKSEHDKRRKIALLEKKYNTTQTELVSLKAAHQQQLALAGVSTSQLVAAQSLKDKSAQELALAQSGQFDKISDMHIKSAETSPPPPPPPSSRHHRTQSFQASQQGSTGSPSRKPPAPPPSKKKRTATPSTTPIEKDNQLTSKDMPPKEDSVSDNVPMTTAVTAGIASVVASAALADVIKTSAPVPEKDDHGEQVSLGEPNVEKALPETLTDSPDQNETTTKALDQPYDAVVDEGNKDLNKTDNVLPETTTIPDEAAPVSTEELAPLSTQDTATTLGVNDDRSTDISKNEGDSVDGTKDTVIPTTIAGDDLDSAAKEAVTEHEVTGAKETATDDEDSSDSGDSSDEDEPAKETPTDGPLGLNDDRVIEESAKKTPTDTLDDTPLGEPIVTEDDVPKETTTDPTLPTNHNPVEEAILDKELTHEDGDKTAAEPSELTKVPDLTAATKESTDATIGNSDKEGLEQQQDTAVSTEQPELPPAADTNEGDAPRNHTETDGTSDILRKEPMSLGGSGNDKQPHLTEPGRSIDNLSTTAATGSPEIHTATTTATGSMKGDDHDFEVVDNASASSSFMSASMGADDDALDEFDAAFSETLPDAKMVSSTTTTTAEPHPATSSNTDGHFDVDDFDDAFDPKVFSPSTATNVTTSQTPHSDQQPKLDDYDPFATNDDGQHSNAFADTFAPPPATASDKKDAPVNFADTFAPPPAAASDKNDAPVNFADAFGDSFTATGSSADDAQKPTTADTSAPTVAAHGDFMDFKELVVSPEQVAHFESNPFDEPSFEHQPDVTGPEQPSVDPSMQQPVKEITPPTEESAPPQQSSPPPLQQLPQQHRDRSLTNDTPHTPTTPRSLEPAFTQPPPAAVSPSVSTASNAHSDRAPRQPAETRPSKTDIAVEEPSHTTSSSKGKHKGLFSLSSMLPKQKGKKSKSKSKKDKAPTIDEPPSSEQQHQEPALETTLPAMSDQEVMANLREFGVDNESMQTLTNMGFTMDQAKEALERYDYDVQKATNFLLDQ